MSIPPQTRIQNPSQDPSERGTNREASTAKRHLERVLHVLVVALGVAPDVQPPPVVVLGERPHHVVDEEHGVVVAEHEPPHVRLVAIHGLLHHARHADRRAQAPAERVREGVGVGGDNDLGRVGGVGGRRRFVEEGEEAGGGGGVPEAEVGEAAGPGEGGGGDGEEKVAARGGGEAGDEGGLGERWGEWGPQEVEVENERER